MSRRQLTARNQAGEYASCQGLKLQKWSSCCPTGIVVILGIVAMGLLIHSPYINELGLYWDDAEFYMQGLQAADGNAARFALSDAPRILPSEKPLGYFAFLISRIAFAISVPAAHWFSVGLLIANAGVLSYVARKIVDEDWFAFSVGGTFLLSPLSALQVIWLSTVHYLVSSLLGLLAILMSLRAIRTKCGDQQRWCIFAFFTYLASLLTHEAAALIPLAFITVYTLTAVVRREPGAGTDLRSQPTLDFATVGGRCLAFLVIAAILYGLWRVALLPIYGLPLHSQPLARLTLQPIALARHVAVGLRTVLFPWVDALWEVLEFPPSPLAVMFSMVPFIVMWAVICRGLRPLASRAYGGNVDDAPRVSALAIAIALVGAAVAYIAVSPAAFVPVNILNPGPRVDYLASFGLAFALPAFAVMMMLLPALFTSLLTSYNRATLAASCGALAVLSYIAIRFPSGGTILSHHSHVPRLFGRYSIMYGIAIVAYAIAVAFTGMMIILCVGVRMRRLLVVPGRANRRLHLTLANLLAVSLASIVLLSSLFHFSIKRQYIAEWNRHKAMLEQLQSIAPGLKDNSFIVIVDTRPDRSYAPYRSHWELSSYVLALYDNWSIMANEYHQLRFHLTGVDSTYYGVMGTWFAPGVRSVRDIYATWFAPGVRGVKDIYAMYATPPARGISYGRLVLFQYDGKKLGILSQLEVWTEEGQRLVVRNNPNRIVAPVRRPSPILQHALQSKTTL